MLVLRNKAKWARFLNKRHLSNPKKGPFHLRAPSRMFWRTVRGMLPHKTYRGQKALARLQVIDLLYRHTVLSRLGLPDSLIRMITQVYEGIPESFEKVKRMSVPDALKVLHSKSYRKTTLMGRLASECGWKHGELIEKLEAQRKEKAAARYTQKKAEDKLKAQAEVAADLSAVNPVLAEFGYYIEPTAVGATKALKAEMASVTATTSAAAEPAAEAPAAEKSGDY